MLEERLELEAWSADWRAAPERPRVSLGQLRRRARRHLVVAVSQWLFGGLFLVLYTSLAWLRPEPPLVVATVAVWLFVLASVGFDLWNRRGTWRPADRTTRAFVELTRRRLTSRLRAVRLGWALLAGESLFFLPWIAWVVGDRPGAGWVNYAQAYGFLALMVAAFAAGLAWQRRRTTRRLAEVLEVERDLRDGPPGADH